MINNFLDSAKQQFEYYKILGEKTFSFASVRGTRNGKAIGLINQCDHCLL